MPDPLRLSEVNERVRKLPWNQLESYVRNLLPNVPQDQSLYLAQALWNTRDLQDNLPEFEAAWKSLTQRLATTYEIVDDLQEKEHERELARENERSALSRSNMMREGEVRIRIEKELNDQLRERQNIERSIRGDAAGTPMVDMDIRGVQGGSGVGDADIRQGPPPAQKPPSAWRSSNMMRGGGVRIKVEKSPPREWGPYTKPFSPESVAPLSEDLGKVASALGGGAALAGKTAWAGLRMGGRGLKKVGGAAANVAGSLGSGGAAEPIGHLWLMFFLGLLFHLYMLFLVDGRVNLGIVASWAIVMAVIFWWASGLDTQAIRPALVYSLTAGVLYGLMGPIGDWSFANQIVVDSFRVFVLIVPIWPIAMWARIQSRRPGSWTAKGFRLYLLLLIFLILGFVIWPILGSSIGAISISTERVDVGDSVRGFTDAFTRTWERIAGRVDSITKLYTNPEYYTGTADENEGKPLGVTIADLRPVDEEVANDSQMMLFGNVETKSFVGESAQIVPNCVIDRKDSPSPSLVDPPVLDVVFGTTASFECAFDPPEEGWHRGVYPITASATFPFQTWAYIPYTFVDEELARNIARQGQELRQVLDIDQDPTAIYTGGPVTLGMGGSDQPLLVRREDEANGWLAPGSRIGVTLGSGWQDGEITHVSEIQLKVPQGFLLKDCDREITAGPEADPNAEGYVTYRFENPADTSIAVDYTTITCKLGLESAQMASELVAAGDKAERTIVAVAMYEYTTTEKSSVRVR